MIEYERFLDDHLNYLFKFREAERKLLAKREDLFRSTDSLISHPETGSVFKTYLLKFRREL